MRKNAALRRLFAATVLVMLAVVPALADHDDEEAIVGVKGGYNFPGMMLSSYEERPDLSIYHVAAYGGYDFGIFSVTGTFWHYFVNVEDGVWRLDGQNPIDQAYIDAGGNGAIAITADIFFDVEVAEDKVFFNPGIGIGPMFAYGQFEQYDYQSKPGAGNIREDKLTEDDVEIDPDSKSDPLPSVLPHVHIDLDWKFLLGDNWFATVNMGLQTTGLGVGAGAGYHF